MINQFDYNDPIITRLRKGTPDDPYVDKVDTLQVEKGTVVLSELPSRLHKVKVTGGDINWVEIENGAPKENQYKVDYTNKIVYFDNKHNGLQLTFTYKGRGLIFVPASMIYTALKGDQIIEVLSDYTKHAANFYFAGSYDPDRIYEKFNIVIYQGAAYICIETTKGNAPTDDRYWLRLSGFNWKGIYSDSQQYLSGDFVTNEERTTVYLAIKDSLGKDLADTEYWAPIIDITETIEYINAAEENRQVAESEREANEEIRKQNEEERIQAEEVRKLAEEERTVAENLRESNEQERINNEQLRIQAEEDRELAELERQDNENVRQQQETERQQNEDVRLQAEQVREQNESQRQEAESVREANEQERIDAENERSDNEFFRTMNEDDRIQAEEIRQQNEQERIKNENIRIGAEEERKQNEEQRSEAEDLRQSNEEDRALAEEARNEAESERVQSENERKENEGQRIANEETRESNEEQRQLAENERKLAEDQREANEAIRQQQEAERQANTAQAIQNVEQATERAENLVNTSVHLGEYDPTVQYVVNNHVRYNGSTWRCLKDCVGITPIEGEYWTLVAQRGLDGKGSVTSVNGKSPNEDGNVVLIPQDIGAESIENRGKPLGYATLDETGNVPLEQLGNVEAMEMHGNEWHTEEFETVEGAQEKANIAEQNAKAYTDQQIQLVTETGIPKLVSYTYRLIAAEDGQKEFEIPLETFDLETDTIMVYQNSTFLSSARYTIEDKIILLNEGVMSGTEIVIIVLKNVPIGEEGAINGRVIAQNSLPMDRVIDLSSELSTIDQRINEVEQSANNNATAINDLDSNAVKRFRGIWAYEDLNNYTTPGVWYLSNEGGHDNAPPGLRYFLLVVLPGHSDTYLTQFAIDITARQFYMRTRRMQEWHEWRKVLVSDDIPSITLTNSIALTSEADAYPYGVTAFNVASQTPGAPTTAGYLALNIRESRNRFTQILFGTGYGGNEKSMHFRHWFDNHGWTDWVEVMTSVPPQWYEAVMENGWTPYSGRTIQYSKLPNGRVTIRGTITGGSTTLNSRIFTLPTGFRPPRLFKASALCWDGTSNPPQLAVLSINESGNVAVDTVPGNAWLSLDGITFFVNE